MASQGLSGRNNQGTSTCVEELSRFSNNIKVYLCHRCKSYQTNKFSYFYKHFQQVHSSEPGFIVRCGINACEKTYAKVESLLSHIRREHKNTFEEESFEISTTGDETESNPETNVHLTSLTTVDRRPNSNSQYKLAMMILKWREKYQLPKTCLNNIITDTEEFVSIHQMEHLQQIKRYVELTGVKIDEWPELQSLFHESVAKSIFGLMNTAARQTSYFRRNFDLVEPVELVLGENEQGKHETFQYIPILQTVKSLLQHDDVFTQVLKSHENCHPAGVLADYCDGAHYQTNKLFNSEQGGRTLYLTLYNDDFEVCNPIGTARKRQKLNGMYLLLGNIEPKYRSKLHVIQLVWLCKNTYLSKYGFGKVSERLIEDLHILEEFGVSVCKNNTEYFFRGSVSIIVADNLASHYIGGFPGSFAANRVCRFCMCTYQNLNECKLKTGCLRRTEALYDKHADLVERDESLISVYGLKCRSAFNSLSFFHVSGGLPSDPMHDLLEGVCPLVWAKVLTHYVTCNFITLDMFNRKMALCDYKGSDKAKKPVPLSWSSGSVLVKQTASQMSCFMRVALYVLGDIVPINDRHWQLLLYLATICDLVFAPAHNGQSISYLHGIIRDFLELYLDIFKDGITPKMHFLTHYGEEVINFGPLMYCSTMRFEAKHSYFKSLARKTNNRKNLALTLAQRHQFLQCWYNQSFSFLEVDDVTSTCGRVLNINSFDQSVKGILQLGLGLGEEQQVYRVSTASTNGLTYAEQSILCTGFCNSFLEFALVNGIFLKSGIIFFLVTKLETLHFSEHYHGYIVRPITVNVPYEMLQEHQLHDPLPLQFSVCNDGMCVAQKYRLLSEFN